MSFNDFYQYYDHISNLLYQENWSAAESAAALLSIRDKHSDLSYLQVEKPENHYSDRNAMNWAFDDIVILHLQTLYLLKHKYYEQACISQTNLLQLFNKEILQKEKDANWFMPILYSICSDLRIIARKADTIASNTRRRKTEATSYFEEAASPIMESYRICVAESRLVPETSKKIAILNLTNHLFRIYFKVFILYM